MKNRTNAGQNNYDLIQRFREFELSKEELEAFDKKLAQDTQLRLELERYQEVETYIDNQLGVSDRQDAMKKNFEALFQQNNQLSISRRWLSVAAILGGFSVAIYVISIYLSSSSVDRLSENYIKDTNKVLFSNTKAPGTEMTASEAILIQSSALMVKDSLNAALKLLNRVPNTDSLFLAAVLLKGQIAMEQQEWNVAISHFQLLLDAPPSSQSYNDIALWNQALAYIKIDSIAQAKNNLTIIVQEQYPQAAKAAPLLKKINNN